MTAWGVRVAIVLVAVFGLAGCSDESGSADAKPSATTSASDPSPDKGSSPSPTEPTTRDSPPSRCLFSLAQVSGVLGGKWDLDQQPAACLYSSDRGAVFTTTQVQQAIEPGLRDARAACVEGIRPISVGDGFVCVEVRDKKQLVVGNTAVGDRLWLLVIVPPSGTASEAELAAMMTLVETAQA